MNEYTNFISHDSTLSGLRSNKPKSTTLRVDRRFHSLTQLIYSNKTTGLHVCSPASISSAGVFRLTVIDKNWPIESIGSSDDSGVRARSTSHRTLDLRLVHLDSHNGTTSNRGVSMVRYGTLVWTKLEL